MSGSHGARERPNERCLIDQARERQTWRGSLFFICSSVVFFVRHFVFFFRLARHSPSLACERKISHLLTLSLILYIFYLSLLLFFALEKTAFGFFCLFCLLCFVSASFFASSYFQSIFKLLIIIFNFTYFCCCCCFFFV